jgi:predicted nucleotide-binding protein with TIR-like domain
MSSSRLWSERRSGSSIAGRQNKRRRSVGTEPPTSTDVFIVHGHDREARAEVARFVERIGLRAIILDEQPDAGLTIIEKLERDAAKVAAAIVVLTPDDVGGAKDAGAVNPRARQNVVFELGYFARALGRGKVYALTRGDAEIPSDYKGVIYTPFDDRGGWRLRSLESSRQLGCPSISASCCRSLGAAVTLTDNVGREHLTGATLSAIASAPNRLHSIGRYRLVSRER